MFVNSKNFSRLMLALTLALLLPVLSLAQQSKQRVVTLKPYKDQPVEITAAKVKGVYIQPKRKFAGDKDWLLGMTITLKNVSDRPVAYASVLVSTYYEKNDKRIKIDGKETQAAIQLMFGERPPGPGESALPYYIAPLPPGHSVDVLLSERSRNDLHSLINGHEAETDVTEITVRIYQVFFEGDSDTMWSTGRMLRRDRNDPQLWTPIKLAVSSGQAIRKPKFVRARLALPVALPLEDPDVTLCTFKYKGDRLDTCTATDSGNSKCVWTNAILNRT